jgi:two-component SAPR family response regulator
MTDPVVMTRDSAAEMPGTQRARAHRLRAVALGGSRVYVDDRLSTPADWTFAKPRELLFYLLTRRASSKHEIGLALWPRASASQLRNSFHTALYHLRRALGAADWIRFEHGRYTVHVPAGHFYDVDAFESGLAAAGEARGASPAAAIDHLRAATDLYAGDFLADFAGSDWVAQRQDELQRRYLDGMLLLGRLLQAEGRHAEAAETYHRAVSRDPLLEAAHRELMRCYLRLGERGQAIRQYERLARRLRDELGAPPAPETTALHRLLRSGAAADGDTPVPAAAIGVARRDTGAEQALPPAPHRAPRQAAVTHDVRGPGGHTGSGRGRTAW